MHIPLPKSGDLQSLEAFRDGLKELEENIRPHVQSIFGDGGFLELSELKPVAPTSAHHVIFSAELFRLRSHLWRCSFRWLTFGCQRAFSLDSERSSESIPDPEILNWREGALEFIRTIESELQDVHDAAEKRVRIVRDAVEGLDQISKTLR